MALPRITKLLNAVGGTGAGSTLTSEQIGRSSAYAKAIAQAILTGTATVALQGSLDGTNWFSLASFTSSDAVEFTMPSYIRGNVTAFTGGTVTLQVTF